MERMTGTGRSLPHSGCRVLLHTDNITAARTSRKAKTKSTAQRRRRRGGAPLDGVPPPDAASQTSEAGGRTRLSGALQAKYHADASKLRSEHVCFEDVTPDVLCDPE